MNDESPQGGGKKPESGDGSASLSPVGCVLVLVTAFLGWMCAGWQLSITSIAMPAAATDILGETGKAEIGAWVGRLVCAFLLGAASGGYLFGWLGDRIGRAKAMALSILWYSVFSAATVFVPIPIFSTLVPGPWQLAILRFITCMGIGGMWPNAIALVSEAWPNISRPLLAGAIGTAANFGIMTLSWIAANHRLVTVDDWRWVMWLGATPVLLGLFVLVAVPESPRWLALKTDGPGAQSAPGLVEIFRPPLIWITILGISLGTVPLFGGWGSSNWVMPWAQQVGQEIGDPGLKARLALARSVPGTISSLLGGALAMLLGRRRCYFLLSLAAFGCAQYLFWFLHPHDDEFAFLCWFGALGFFSGFFFGWLPLFLPELFPTRVRATGAGVSFNWGRILTAVGVLMAGETMLQFFGGYAEIGRVTSLIYAVGMVVILFAPDTSQKQLDD